ncbi:MAG: hypothetical protein ACT4ON_15765 [Bacteroidota bacterium]
MKRVISIFLICIFLFNTVGYYIAFKAVHFAVKKEIKTQIKLSLDNAELTTITINKKDLATVEWKDGGKEMIYDNEMYDIVRSTETATSVTYFCIHDKKEKLLFANLEEHIITYIAADKPVKNPASKKLIDHAIKLYYSNEDIFLFNIHSQFFFSFAKPNYTPALIRTDCPPPELV